MKAIEKYLPAGVILGIILSACSTPKSTVAYTEDLSPNRPVFGNTVTAPAKKADTDAVTTRVAVSHNVNARVDAVLDSIDKINLTKRYTDGFTIQIYSGQKREDAMLAKQKMAIEVSELTSSLQYVQPKFRVTVGTYLTRLDAQKDLLRLRRHFNGAILVPEKILLK